MSTTRTTAGDRMPPGCPPPKRGPSRAEAGMKNLPRCGGEGLNSKLPCAMKPLRSNIPLISHHVSQAPIVFTLCPCAWQPIGGNLAAGLLRNYSSKEKGIRGMTHSASLTATPGNAARCPGPLLHPPCGLVFDRQRSKVPKTDWTLAIIVLRILPGGTGPGRERGPVYRPGEEV